MNLLEIVVEYAKSGLSIIPTKIDTKQPVIKWKQYQTEIADESILQKWFKNDAAVACICGEVSGNLEVIDIDNHFGDANKIFSEFIALIEGTQSDLIPKLTVETTQNGGYHIIYRCQKAGHNSKLARRWRNKTQDTIIETRGEGGYVLIDPSQGYHVVSGSILTISTISNEEREILHSVARCFDECDETQSASTDQNLGYEAAELPGAAFNERGNVHETLVSHGWTLMSKLNDRELWCRPGKEKGVSATFNFVKDKFYVFSSNAYPFESGRTYSKFAVETILNFDGDFKSAAKDLAKRGFGKFKNGNGSASQMGLGGQNSSNTATKTDKKQQSHDNQNTDGSLFLKYIEMTDTGNAQRFYNLWKGKVKYNHSLGKWFIWNNKYWQQDDTQQIVEFAKKTVKSIKTEALSIADTDRQNKMLKFAISSENSGKIDALLKLAQSIPGIATTSNDMDTNPYYFNLNNGIYDLKTNQLLKHNPDFNISKISNTDFDPEAQCVYWIDSLYTYFNNDVEQVKFIQKICGLTMCGDHLEEIIFFLYGLGKNGKSVFIKVLETIFGDYSQKAPVEMLLLNKNESTIPNDVARLKGARFVVTSELPKGKRLNENRVKDLTGGDKITARFLHKEFFEFRPTHKLWIYGNHKPVIHGNDEGIWRRIMLIPFLYTIPPEEQKPPSVLQAQFEAERNGILKWFIDGWVLYQQEGLKPPETIKRATKEYREEEDVLVDFIDEMCDTSSSSNKVKTKDLHNHYVKWCESNNEPVLLKSKSFNTTIEEKGFKKVESGHGREREFVGIAIKGGMF